MVAVSTCFESATATPSAYARTHLGLGSICSSIRDIAGPSAESITSSSGFLVTIGQASGAGSSRAPRVPRATQRLAVLRHCNGACPFNILNALRQVERLRGLI